jgi:cytochrome b involved in lipid metabolism
MAASQPSLVFESVQDVEEYQRKNPQLLIMIFNGKVLDLTTFADVHPGGAEVLTTLKGKDGSVAFKDVGHTADAYNTAMSKVIGVIKSAAAASSDSARAPVMTEEERRRRIAAVKPSAIWGYVPLMVGLVVGTVVYVAIKELRARK